MSASTLFLAWQDKRQRRWFPVGRLDTEAQPRSYRFRYIGGAKRACETAGFPLFYEFPKLTGDYRSPELFPLFTNRVIAPGRPDRAGYLENLGLGEQADPFEILSVSGGRRATDVYEVFPKIDKRENGEFTCRFFLHGWRHVPHSARERIDRLRVGETLFVTLELTNPATGFAVQIQTEDYHVIGWSPRYLVTDLVEAINDSPEYSARVVRVNRQPAPSKQRVLVEMDGRWKSHTPMKHDDFKPLA